MFLPDESDEMRKWMREFEKYFVDKKSGPTSATKKSIGAGRSTDAEHNALVDISAMKLFRSTRPLLS